MKFSILFVNINNSYNDYLFLFLSDTKSSLENSVDHHLYFMVVENEFER